MNQQRNDTLDLRPLTARSVLLSALLGTTPPRLPASRLVRAAALFGISEGAARTALSRLAAAGDVAQDDGWYQLSARLTARQQRQDASRDDFGFAWDGRWELAVVAVERRSATARAELRSAMASLRLAEMREGVWVRPANLPAKRLPAEAAVVAVQCRRWTGAPVDDDPPELAARLWPLGRWAERTHAILERIEAGGDMAERFVTSAAALRHMLADPLLPEALLPPEWPGHAFRARFAGFYRTYQGELQTYLTG